MIGRILIMAGFLLGFAASAQGAPAEVRTYVLYGQGGQAWSYGIDKLADNLQEMNPGLRVSTHEWEHYRQVANDIRKLPADAPVILIGYSLGANATTWISNAVAPRAIDLIVAYDPSVKAKVERAGSNVRRVLLYHNTSLEPYGHARIPGPQVETTETRNSHLTIGNSAWLHGKTRAAVVKVLADSESAEQRTTGTPRN
jgi:hypothetical protein